MLPFGIEIKIKEKKAATITIATTMTNRYFNNVELPISFKILKEHTMNGIGNAMKTISLHIVMEHNKSQEENR